MVHSLRFSEETPNWLTVIDLMRPIQIVMPDSNLRDAQCVIDRRRHTFRSLRVRCGMAADLIRRPDDAASLDAATGEEDRLHSAPVITPWKLVSTRHERNPRSPTEFARHDHQGRVE